MADPLEWLVSCDEPWTRYCALGALLRRPAGDPEVRAARQDMLRHPLVQGLVARAGTWPGGPIHRHNDSAHPIHVLGVLADFGLAVGDPGMPAVADAVLAHLSPEGALQSVVAIPEAFGGTGTEQWTWLACDAPLLLYALLALGMRDDPRLTRAADHLLSLSADNGWGCRVAPELGRFRGPGKRTDPCPIANVYALKALSQAEHAEQHPAVLRGIDALLTHWSSRQKWYLFGAGTDFRKLKYPFVWYDILHVTDVLTRYPAARRDPRLREMVDAVAAQADAAGRYTPTSMYRPWQGWSFADKKHPSPWLTFLVLRVQQRLS
jgi:hypothetical protein